jgi:hypothetical protein
MRTTSLVLLCLLSAPALAQRVVILEFEGDRNDHLRTQVENALKKANTVDLIPVARWKDLAGKKKLKGPQAMTAAAVAKLSRSAGVDAAVEGVLGDKFFVRILDSTGQELWSKELPMKKGMLSDDHAKKLAKAITAAAKTAPTSTREDEEKPPEEKPPKVAEKPEERDPDQPRRPGDMSDDERAKRRQEEEAEAHSSSEVREPATPERDQDLETEGKKQKIKIGPKLVRVWLAGTTTWRSYCSRPGVNSCGQYDSTTPKPDGVIVNFSPEVPYAGFSISAEAFPFTLVTDSWAQGFGLMGSFALGFSLTNVRVSSDAGMTPTKQVVSTDRSWSAQATYRYSFGLGSGKDTLVGFLGLRFGVASRVFEIDAKAEVALPGGYRLFPQFGIDGSLPLGTRFARLEAGFTYFISPKPGPDEIQGYGNFNDPTGGATGSGFGFEAGVAGEVWGPLGYMVKFHYSRFGDRFYGRGTQWTAPSVPDCTNNPLCGGAAEEVYFGVVWGVTASF